MRRNQHTGNEAPRRADQRSAIRRRNSPPLPRLRRPPAAGRGNRRCNRFTVTKKLPPGLRSPRLERRLRLPILAGQEDRDVG